MTPGTITPAFLMRILLTLAFVLSLMQYWVNVGNAGVIALALVYVAAFLALLSKNRVAILANILGGGSLLILFSLLTEVVSYYTQAIESVQYGLVLILMFLAARLIILHLGFLEIVRCYAYSAIFCALVILVAGRKQLSGYQGGETRFTGGSYTHPNLLGFTFASYVPLFVGLAMDLKPGKRRLFLIGLSVATFAMLFTTGSRGSLGAVVLAALILAVRFLLFNPIVGKLRFKPMHIVLTLLGAAGLMLVLFRGNHLKHLVDFLNDALQLNSHYRGIHSGFSGRTFFWVFALSRLHSLQWLFGVGFRPPIVIDNGYLTILYENGILGASVILGVILRMFYWVWRDTAHIESVGWWRYRTVLLSLLIIYLINNVTTRYLFGMGNQFSLLVLFMMVCRREELLGRRAVQKQPRRLRKPTPRAHDGSLQPIESR